MAGFLNRQRAEQLMQNEGLSALVLCQPESIVYATGAFPGVASYWRRAGAAFVIVPADANLPLTAIVGDLQARSFTTQSGITDVRTHRLWVETSQYPFEAATMPSPGPANMTSTQAFPFCAMRLPNVACCTSASGSNWALCPRRIF